MGNSMLDVAILLGSVRPERIGIKPASYLLRKCRERGFQTTLVDPLELKLPLLERMYKEYRPGEAPDVLTRLREIIQRADGYIVASAEYNHSIPPALSNLIDHSTSCSPNHVEKNPARFAISGRITKTRQRNNDRWATAAYSAASNDGRAVTDGTRG